MNDRKPNPTRLNADFFTTGSNEAAPLTYDEKMERAIRLSYIHRVDSIHCEHYEDCLALAGTQKWKGWSCRKCSFSEGLLITPIKSQLPSH